MRGHNIRFHLEIRKIIFELSSVPPLSGALLADMAEPPDPMTSAANNPKSDYFRCYGSVNVHELMLKDKPRTLAYKQFIEQNCDLFKDKIVLDIGAGTGILSLFAAKAGAKRVFAVEASKIAKSCEEIVKINNFEKVIVVINEMVENVELPVSKVDVIVSEWMGFYLLHESMLDSVLFARDKWLAEDGLMVPSHAVVYCAPVNMNEYCLDHFEYWSDVYGFDFSPLSSASVLSTLQQPVIEYINSKQILAKPEILIKYDLKEIKLKDVQEIEEKFSFDINFPSVLHGLVFWFDVKFCRAQEITENSVSNGLESPILDETIDENLNVTLSTSPDSEETHWKQTICFLPVSVTVEKGETIYSRVTLSQDESNKRFYNISLELLEDLDSSSEEEYDSEDELDDISNHPIPCDCQAGRCKIISALMEKYDAEQTELEMEAEFVDVTAEVQAAETLDKEGLGNDSSLLAADDSEGMISEDNIKEEKQN